MYIATNSQVSPLQASKTPGAGGSQDIQDLPGPMALQSILQDANQLDNLKNFMWMLLPGRCALDYYSSWQNAVLLNPTGKMEF